MKRNILINFRGILFTIDFVTGMSKRNVSQYTNKRKKIDMQSLICNIELWLLLFFKEKDYQRQTLHFHTLPITFYWYFSIYKSDFTQNKCFDFFIEL